MTAIWFKQGCEESLPPIAKIHLVVNVDIAFVRIDLPVVGDQSVVNEFMMFFAKRD